MASRQVDARSGPRGPNNGFPQFLLLFVGITCLVVGKWSLPRHQKTAELERERDGLRTTLNEVQVENARYRRMTDALKHDPVFREGIYRQVTGERRDGEFTVPEWIQRAREEGATLP